MQVAALREKSMLIFFIFKVSDSVHFSQIQIKEDMPALLMILYDVDFFPQEATVQGHFYLLALWETRENLSKEYIMG